jgi:hypothetical protein
MTATIGPAHGDRGDHHRQSMPIPARASSGDDGGSLVLAGVVNAAIYLKVERNREERESVARNNDNSGPDSYSQDSGICPHLRTRSHLRRRRR